MSDPIQNKQPLPIQAICAFISRDLRHTATATTATTMAETLPPPRRTTHPARAHSMRRRNTPGACAFNREPVIGYYDHRTCGNSGNSGNICSRISKNFSGRISFNSVRSGTLALFVIATFGVGLLVGNAISSGSNTELTQTVPRKMLDAAAEKLQKCKGAKTCIDASGKWRNGNGGPCNMEVWSRLQNQWGEDCMAKCDFRRSSAMSLAAQASQECKDCAVKIVNKAKEDGCQ